MKLHLLIYCVYSLCLWTVNSQGVTDNGNTRIQGPTFFVTDTTRDLTLSCQTNLSAAVDFAWRHRELNPCSVAALNNCTFRPQMQDDGDNVTCIPQDAKFKPLGLASYELHLKYPPPSYPTITMEPYQTEPLKQGDVITCTVSGGKPRVSSVTFYCQHPDLADLDDNVNNETHTVSSSIIVNTSLPTDVDMACTCYANWAPEPGLYSHRTNASFKLQHPPQSSPIITIKPNQREPLGQGDTITCTVSGGNPLVANVLFHCQNPHLADQVDEISEDDRTVSSSITVNTFDATEDSMTCTCSAHWDPKPGRYPDRTNMSFQLEYKATVTEFTLNDTSKLTVNETSNSTVTFTCLADGRPSPDLRFYKQGEGPLLIQAGINASTQELVYTIDHVRGEDMAAYRCEADNGVSSPNNAHVQLFVNSAPQIKDNSYNPVNPPELPQAGLTFSLVAYPTPEFKGSYFLENENVMKKEPVRNTTFQTQCARNTSVKHLVNCEITSMEWETIDKGLYEIYFTNGLGDVSFRVKRVPHQPELWKIIVGVSIAVVVVVALVVGSIVFYCIRQGWITCCKGHIGASNHTDTLSTTADQDNSRTNTHAKDQNESSLMATHSEGGYDTADEIAKSDRCSRDSKGYAIVRDTANNTSLQGSNKAVPTRHNNVQTPGYEDVELDTMGAPKVMTTPGKPDVVASIPEDSHNAPLARRNNVQGYEDVELDPMGAPKVMTTPENPDAVASIPEDSTERTTAPNGDIYAKVATKQKGDNVSPNDNA